MEKRYDDISASDLLAKLKANMAESETQTDDIPEPPAELSSRKVYRFRRSGKTAAVVTEEEIRREMPAEEEQVFVSPVPKSDIEDLDIEELMKKYLPEEDYVKMASREQVETVEEEDELVRTLTSIEPIRDETAETVGEETAYHEEREGEYTAPDSELFAHLSKNGKVCDVPGEDEMSDTRNAPLRPMDEAEQMTLFGAVGEDEEEGFRSLSDLETAMPAEETSAKEETEPVFVDDVPTMDFVSLADEVLKEVSLEAEEETVEEIQPESETPVETLAVAEAAPVSDTVVFALPDESAADVPVNTEATSEFDMMALAAQIDGDSNADASEAEETPTEDLPAEELENVPMVVEENDDPASFDETDANLMLAFGMDEELDRAIGKESADKLRDQMDELIPEEEKPAKAKAERPSFTKEFISPAETKDIVESYKTAYGKTALRLFGILAVAIVLFFYENLTALGGSLADALNPAYYPVVNVMVGLQILLVGFALCYPNLVRGFYGLVDKKPTPDSFLPILLGVSILYSAAVCFFPAGTVFVTFHFPVSLCLLMTVVCERLDLRREIMTFNIVSSKRTKFALEKLDMENAELETRAFDEFLPTSPSIFKINKTSFVDGYFRRTKDYPSLKLILGALIPAMLVALVVGILVGVFKFRSWESAVMLGYTVFSFCMPTSLFLTFGLPAFKASQVAYGMNSAFVGEAALDEYTTAASISFDDREVFPTGGVKLRSIKVFGSGRIDTVIYNVASVYSQLGGPLADVLNVATADLGHSEEVEILVIENEGVEAIVDDHHLYLGKADYLRKHGYVPVSDPDDEDIEGAGEISIMFLVCDDEVVAKLYVRYRIDSEFEVTLKNLYRSGICVGIKTIDPNINDEMLSTRIRLSKYPVRVLKYSDITDSYRGSDRTDSGIVSKKSAKALLRTFTLCDKVKHVTRTNLVVNILTMGVGLIISLAVALLGSITGIHSVYVALFQLFWLLPVYLMSRFMLM